MNRSQLLREIEESIDYMINKIQKEGGTESNKKALDDFYTLKGLAFMHSK